MSEDVADGADDSDDESLVELEPVEDQSDTDSEAPTVASLTRAPDEEIDGEILLSKVPKPELQEVIIFNSGETSLQEASDASRKTKNKKILDPAALAQRRVSIRLQKERKAAKKARRREKARAKKTERRRC